MWHTAQTDKECGGLRRLPIKWCLVVVISLLQYCAWGRVWPLPCMLHHHIVKSYGICLLQLLCSTVCFSDMQQPPFYASFQMGSHDPRMLPPQQYGGQPFPIANPPLVSNSLTSSIHCNIVFSREQVWLLHLFLHILEPCLLMLEPLPTTFCGFIYASPSLCCTPTDGFDPTTATNSSYYYTIWNYIW